MVHTDYVITGDRTNFFINNVKRHGRYFIVSQETDREDLFTYIQ